MDFQKILDSEKTMLLDFYADWCPPCRAMVPVLGDLQALVGNGLFILKVDIDEQPVLAEHFQVTTVPTFILFKKGGIVWRKTGMSSSTELQRAVEIAANTNHISN